MSPAAAKKGAAITPGEAYAKIIAMFEEHEDMTDEVCPLDVFLGDEEWADLPLRPRQKLILKVIDNAANQMDLEHRLTQFRLDDGTDKGLDLDTCLAFMGNSPHAVSRRTDGSFWYDELADWRYLLKGDNDYARAFCNVKLGSKEPRTVILIMGRGSSKTTVFSAGVSAHQAHRILSAPNPHALFKLAALKPLRIQNVATSSDQAGEFFDAFVNLIGRVKWFDGRYSPPIKGMMKFGPHLWAEKTSSNSRSTRGRDTVVYVHDEVAFNDKTDGPRSDKALYTAIRAAVKTRAKGLGLIVLGSSPAEADGVLYDLYCQAVEGKLENSIVLQLASWEMIPGQVKDDYAEEYRKDPDIAEMEYGAQFYTGAKLLLPGIKEKMPAFEANYKLITQSDAPLIWIPRPSDPDELKEHRRKQRRHSRVIHIDTSEGFDRLALSMQHVRGNRVVIDLMRVWDREVGYTKELIPFIRKLKEYVPIDQVSFDQFDSHQLIQDLQDMGINAVKTPFTQAYNDEIARNFRNAVMEGLLATYSVPQEIHRNLTSILDKGGWEDDDKLWPYVSMAILHREMEVIKKVVKGRYVSAEAPTAGPVQHDDAFDAAAACLVQALILNGGAGNFFTLARGIEGVSKDEVSDLPGRAKPPKDAKSYYCQHHKGYVWIASGDKIVPCPDCGNHIQLRL